MRAANYDFYGDRNQCQKALITFVNNQFQPPISEIEGGMCYMLSMQFLLDYLSHTNPAQTAEAVFDTLTSRQDQGAYLRQVAGNFRAYIDSRFSLKNLDAQTGTYIQELSRGQCRATHLTSFTTHTPPSVISEPSSPRRGLLLVLYYQNNSGTHGHAVAVVQDAGNYALYDPNYGICRFNAVTDICNTALPAIYAPTGMREHLYLIQS